MRFLFATIVAFVIALVGGGWSAALVMDRFDGAGSLRVGPWEANRLSGSPEADPYSKARAARDGDLTLGLGEGIALRAARDSVGEILQRRCIYRLAGRTPAARLWTLSAFDPEGRALRPSTGRPAGLVSNDLLRSDENDALVHVGPVAQAGNWLAVDGTGPMILALTLYDTPATSSTGGGEISMPTIELVRCVPDA